MDHAKTFRTLPVPEEPADARLVAADSKTTI
jgi:hypothetical protein